MKKLLIVLIMTFCLSGCKGSYIDAYNMIDKVNTVGEEETFNDVYIKGINYNKEEETNYIFKKENDNYYIEIDGVKTYIISNNNAYHVYTNDMKHYKTEENIGDILKVYLTINTINPSLNDTHINIANHLRNLLGLCKDSKAVCKIEKDLFNKMNIEIIQESEMSQRISVYMIDNGKIKYVSSEYKEDGIYLKTVLEFDYGKQKIENIDKSKYEIVNENS